MLFLNSILSILNSKNGKITIFWRKSIITHWSIDQIYSQNDCLGREAAYLYILIEILLKQKRLCTSKCQNWQKTEKSIFSQKIIALRDPYTTLFWAKNSQDIFSRQKERENQFEAVIWKIRCILAHPTDHWDEFSFAEMLNMMNRSRAYWFEEKQVTRRLFCIGWSNFWCLLFCYEYWLLPRLETIDSRMA